MNINSVFRGLLSAVLTKVLFLCIFLPAEAKTEEPDHPLYFGLLHAHTDLSGGEGSVEDAFREASAVEGLDFFAVTDFSHSLDNDAAGDIALDGAEVSENWAAGKAAAKAATSENFVALYGYEMGFRDSSYFGHITTFRTPGFLSRNKDGFDTLTAYYDALTTVPGSVSQFNHPTSTHNFTTFSHRTDAGDDAVSLLEIGSHGGIDKTHFSNYVTALEQGWHVAPTISQTNFHGSFGTESQVRTVLLAEELTQDGLCDAMANRRCYATEDADLEIRFRLNGSVMGSIVPLAEKLTITVSIRDATDGPGGRLEVFDGGENPCAVSAITGEGSVTLELPSEAGYYFLRFTQEDGDAAVTAPVWVEAVSEPEPSEPSGPEKPEDPTTESSEPEASGPDASGEPAEPEESRPEEDRPPEDPMADLGVRFCFGLLHGHTGLSDGKGTPEEAYAAAAGMESMDFYALTEHSNSFDNDLSGTIGEDAAAVSQLWARCKAAAQQATNPDFVGIFGYEMTWPDSRSLGHITTFATPGFLSRNRADMAELADYYESLTAVPGSVSQFCHPGPQTGEFGNFAGRTVAYDSVMTQLEIGGEEGLDSLQYYVRALDAGWHVSPTASHNDHEGNFGALNACRTVILAEELTEKALYEAMGKMRTYATEDCDLKIYYTLDGQRMGSILPAGDQHALRLLASDPTDTGVTRVEIITGGGETLLSCPLPESGELNLIIPGGQNYYFLRLIQADGDIAVTAPVWTETYDNIGIAAFSADIQVPLPGQKVTLDLTLYNEENVSLSVTALKLLADGEPVCTLEYPGLVETGKTRSFSVPYIRDSAGAVTLTAVVEGTADGQVRTFCQELTLHFRAKEMVKGILIRLDHSGLDAGDFDNLSVLAADANMTVHCFSGSLPENGSILLLPPPEKAYDTEFLQQVKIFCARGGVLVVCGCSGEENPQAAQYQNRLLQILGSTMTLRADTALDEVHNGGTPEELYPMVFNDDAVLCREITQEQFYVHLSGATVEPGQGTWLVTGGKTAVSSQIGETSPVLLAWEEPAAGGRVLVSGSLFLGDGSMDLPKNRWDAPTANQSVVEALLGITREKFPITPIAQVRRGRKGSLYHIKGFTTSGTSNRFNTFPDTLYLQDDTGGIAVTPFRETGISVGTPMVIAGYLDKDENGNRILRPVDYDFPEERSYRYVPETMNSSRLTDYETYGGQLVQAEAEVTALTLTEDGLGVSRFTLTDAWGDSITVLIEDAIFSGAYGTNTLAEEVRIGRKVRAMGLLHLDENRVPVIRVRNCAEVVWVPPVPHPDARERTRNPYTGDTARFWAVSLIISGLSLHHIRCGRKRKHTGKNAG